MIQPLKGLRVVDCSFGALGQAAGILSDYGADVIKIEPPGGDGAREMEPAAAAVFNRGKRSVVLDIGQASDRERLRRLADGADILIESWPSGLADSHALGYATLHARNPALIYASLSGFGPDTRYSELPPYEALVHALFGSMAQQAGHREGPIFEGLPFAATGAAHLLLIGLLAALFRRLDDGFGRRVETSLLDGALAFHSMFWGESDATLAAKRGNPIDLRGPSTTRMVTRSFLCGDGEYIGVHTGAVGAFTRLMEVLGLSSEIPGSPDGIDLGKPLPLDQAKLLESCIHGIFASRPRSEWVKRLAEADICGVQHLPPTAAFDEPQVRHNAMVVTVEDPVLGRTEQVAPVIRFDGAPPATPRRAPRVGEHTDDLQQTSHWRDAASPWTLRRPGAVLPDARPLLDGVRILDLGAFYAGPYSSRLLADLGAQVIKVEPLGGDPLRGLERPFFSAQAGKRALAADLKEPDLRPAIRDLVAWADIVHHNMRPGADERLGVSPAQVRALNPQAIYLYAPGWGRTGPDRMRQSFAPMMSAFVGASYEVAGRFNDPLPCVGNEDPGNGLVGAAALLMALLHRKVTGKPLLCENPQLNATLGMMSHIVRAQGVVVGAERLDVLQMGVDALESLYATRDGWICLVARQDDEIRALEGALSIRILADLRYSTAASRRENRDDLYDLIRPFFDDRPTQDCLAQFEHLGVSVVLPAGGDFTHAFMNDPVQRKLGRVAEVPHKQLGDVRELAQLVRISDTEHLPHRLAPGLGEHSDEILRDLGYAAEKIAGLRSRGSVR